MEGMSSMFLFEIIKKSYSFHLSIADIPVFTLQKARASRYAIRMAQRLLAMQLLRA